MRAIDRFCIRHPRFGIPNLMLFIAVGNAVVLILSLMDTTGLLSYYIAFSAGEIFMRGQVWRLITFLLIPPPSWGIIFSAIAIYFYYWIGSSLERQWGTGRFTIYYFAGVLFTIIYGVLFWLITGFSLPMNAVYINLSMFFSFAVLWPDMRLLLMFIIPVKIKWLALINAGLFIYSMITTPFPLNLLPLVAILNFLLFCGGDLWAHIQPHFARRKPGAVNFRKAARKIRREQHNAPYSRKCEFCGKTDADYPNLEFRYCSRCAGFHCFCVDHINSHVHFK